MLLNTAAYIIVLAHHRDYFTYTLSKGKLTLNADHSFWRDFCVHRKGPTTEAVKLQYLEAACRRYYLRLQLLLLRGLNWLQLIIIAENSVISICFSCVNVCRLLGLLSFNSMELLLHIRISQITHALWWTFIHTLSWPYLHGYNTYHSKSYGSQFNENRSAQWHGDCPLLIEFG